MARALRTSKGHNAGAIAPASVICVSRSVVAGVRSSSKHQLSATELSITKLKAGRLNREIPDGCLQFWGGMGYTWENKVARMYRDGRLASIGGGADEVMLQILAKTMGIAKRPPKA